MGLGDEFIVLGNDPSWALQHDPDNLLRTKPECQGEVLLHVPTGQIINWITDPEGNVRMFLQPFREDGTVDPEAAVMLPLGFDEFMDDGEGNDGEGDGGERPLTEKDKRRKKWEEEDKRRREKWEKEDKDRAEAQLQEDAEFLQKVYEEAEVDRLKALAQEEKFALQLLDDEEAPAEDQSLTDRPVGGDEDAEREVTAATTEKELSVDKVERDGGVEGGNKAGDEEVEEEDEDEDDGKPTSFGKVAMVDSEALTVKPSTCRSSESTGPRFPPFPTVFASLSMHVQVFVFLSSAFDLPRDTC